MTLSQGTSRRGLFKLAAAAGVAATSATLLGCSRTETNTSGGGTDTGGSLLAQAKERGYLTVGFAGEAPYAFKDGGDLTGQAPAVHGKIWKALGIEELRGVQVGFGQLIPGLNAKRFDAVAAGMFILPERCAQAQFSEPVYVAPQAFLVPDGNPEKITDYKSVASAGVPLGVLPGAVEGIHARKQGVTELVEVSSQRDALSALKAGRIKAFALTSISLRNMLEQEQGAKLTLTEPFTPVIDGKEQLGAGAAVFRRENKDLLDAFNGELAKLKESGELLSLIEPFGFGPETIPPADLTTEKLCQG
ncbi:ectoine/hydroxyectoine ABC transporter substrate-binding protein EhuB [Micromonospora sp. WMMD1128]|uniref:ectoine/hydroxyectoine ABC transporter substrate-binding protein EhuB n=1 Tax=unclassified Micromonospora TaxID=2617518 RepID=UPI00248C993C|nr:MULTISPECIES: ectoine/hydroxyectoine ABC transporter substrate-binding protein EhuB [unclassified Micromonospora]WBB72083.1 ectoine/hydroxyectoine ABC transporter substrate-binding protein EhuB [Micromonospora sp. WMMD1128]WFE34456.1 ectoine/hydroxyectoine ABC transporter substrate-binding protein EhuB [Micromonospora sp. WMMD975]